MCVHLCFLRQVIVTVPLYLLKSKRLKFTPDLPDKKQTAINNLGAGLIEKVSTWQVFLHSLSWDIF